MNFIYSQRIRQLLAHGSREIRLNDGTIVEVPKGRRTMSKRAIVRAYNVEKEEKGIKRSWSDNGDEATEKVD